MIFPIGFSIPECKIVKDIPPKLKNMATIIPGELSTYIFNSEEEYNHDYQISKFAITKLKAGWDCFRHYEILANGCIPIFENIEKCPKTTMTFFPKNLIKLAKDDPDNYSKELLEYTKKYLTTKSMANYILQESGNSNAKNILFLSGNLNPDYLRCLTLHGFKELMGKDCHDYPCVSHIYSDFPESCPLYGNGFNYSRLLDKKTTRKDELDKTVEEDIRNKKYDCIIYGSAHRGLPYLDLVNQTYDPSNIIFLCGEDLHSGCFLFNLSEKGYPVFIREL